MMKDILKTLIVGLVDNKEAVVITEKDEDRFVKLSVVVDKNDIGRVIGKEGKIANALSTLINSIAYKSEQRKKYIIKINEGQR